MQQNNSPASGTEVLTLEQWVELAQSGVDIPVNVPVSGISMTPLIRHLKDQATLIPLRRKLVLGDIIVFKTATGKLTIHRVCKLTENTVQTLGDHLVVMDAPVPYANVCGLVTHVCRGKRRIYVDTPAWRLYGRFFHWIRPVRRVGREKFYRPVIEVLKKIKRAIIK